MSELTEFLLARIAEDEAVAKAAIEDDGGETGGMEESFDQLTGRTDWFGAPVLPKYGDPLAALIVHTAVPARVLRECEAKRRIVEDHEPYDSEATGAVRCFTCGAGNHSWPCRTMAALVSIYADHPDYRDEWKP